MEIASVDVGQGSCTVVSPHKPESPLILTDCGSSSNKIRAVGKTTQTELITSIVKVINDNAGKFSAAGKAKELIVVISHADKDHYNLLVPVIAEILKNRRYVCFTTLFLGGTEQDYTSLVEWGNKKIGFKSFIKDILQSKHGVRVFFPSEFSTIHNVLKPTNTDYPFQIIFVPKDSKHKTNAIEADKNAMSLIVQVIYDGKKALIQGDATDKTTDLHSKIAQKSSTMVPVPSPDAPGYTLCNLSNSDIASQLVIASHHGASDGCNGLAWLQKVSPSHIVLSSGVDATYRHPREETVLACLNTILSGTISPARLHSVYYGLEKPKKFDKEPQELRNGEFKDGYAVTMTNKHLYGTLGQGTIVFLFDTGQSIGEPECSRSSSSYTCDRGLALLKRTNPTSEEGKSLYESPDGKKLLNPSLGFKALVSLHLPHLDLTKTGVKNELLMVLKALASEEHAVEALYFDESNIGSDDQIIDELCKVIKQKDGIRILTIKKGGLKPASLGTKSDEKKIQEDWGYRALTILN
jgi:hypothetical protein